jgi:hypothetical protein
MQNRDTATPTSRFVDDVERFVNRVSKELLILPLSIYESKQEADLKPEMRNGAR